MRSRTLLCAVWGPANTHEAHYVRTYLYRLRQKLERDPNHPRHLVTQARRGYRSSPDHAEVASESVLSHGAEEFARLEGDPQLGPDVR